MGRRFDKFRKGGEEKKGLIIIFMVGGLGWVFGAKFLLRGNCCNIFWGF